MKRTSLWSKLVALAVCCLALVSGSSSAFADAAASSSSSRKNSAADPLDWTNWRGPEQNRVSREKNLVDKFDPRGGPKSNILWKTADGAGISTPIVMRGKLYTLARHEPDSPQEAEKVVCLDAATGEKLWENIFNVYLSDVPADRVGWSSVVGDPSTGRVYALGVCGLFLCIDGETGKTVWSRPLHEEFGLLSTYGGRTNFPVVFENLVIISGVMTNWGDQALPAHRFLGLDKNTGEVVWFSGTQVRPEDTTYSTPFIGVIDGQRVMVVGAGDGAVWAFQPRTGRPLWAFQFSQRGLNASPVIHDNMIYAGNGEENFGETTMGSIVAIDGLKAASAAQDPQATLTSSDGIKVPNVTDIAEVWRQRGRMVDKSSLCVVDDPEFGTRVYATDNGGKLYVMDAKTGEDICRPVKLVGTIMRSSPLYADGKLYLTTTSGWHVVQPTKDGVRIVDRKRLKLEDEVSGSPIVSHGRIYLPTASSIYCIGSADQQPSADPIPEQPDETPVERDQTPAHVQVVPAEALIRPGESIEYKVRLFNARGQQLGDEQPQATFAVEGPAKIDGQGRLTADANASHQPVFVTIKVGDLEGKARVRVVPGLPWQFDFDKIPLTGPKNQGEAPVTWVGARYRHVVRKGPDGGQVLVKVNTIPKGTRSQSWMGHADMHDYTIQADVMGDFSTSKLPDIGLIAQGYILDLMGEQEQLQIRTWSSTLRNAKNLPFKWEPHVWYTMKFRAESHGDRAVLKGKVWKRGESEPTDWMLELVDESPNLTGSPGLFGNAQVSEIYLDNISVTPND